MFGNDDSGSTDNTCFSNNSFDTVDVELVSVDVRTRLSNVAIGNISIPLCLISHIKQGLLFSLDSFFRFLDDTDDDDDDDEQRHIVHFSSSSTALSGISNLWILLTCGFVDGGFVDSYSARAVATDIIKEIAEMKYINKQTKSIRLLLALKPIKYISN